MGGKTGYFSHQDAVFAMPKACAVCGRPFFKPQVIAHPVWAKRRYCSKSCAGKGGKAHENPRP